MSEAQTENMLKQFLGMETWGRFCPQGETGPRTSVGRGNVVSHSPAIQPAETILKLKNRDLKKESGKKTIFHHFYTAVHSPSHSHRF